MDLGPPPRTLERKLFQYPGVPLRNEAGWVFDSKATHSQRGILRPSSLRVSSTPAFLDPCRLLRVTFTWTISTSWWFVRLLSDYSLDMLDFYMRLIWSVKGTEPTDATRRLQSIDIDYQLDQAQWDLLVNLDRAKQTYAALGEGPKRDAIRDAMEDEALTKIADGGWSTDRDELAEFLDGREDARPLRMPDIRSRGEDGQVVSNPGLLTMRDQVVEARIPFKLRKYSVAVVDLICPVPLSVGKSFSADAKDWFDDSIASWKGEPVLGGYLFTIRGVLPAPAAEVEDHANELGWPPKGFESAQMEVNQSGDQDGDPAIRFALEKMDFDAGWKTAVRACEV